MSTRRTALRLGTGALVAGAAALAWRAWDQGVFNAGKGPAYEAWNTWNATAPGSELELVHAAILAANPHNTQPWRFRVSEHRIDVFADLTRNIGAIDPFRREMHIGLGCALENLLQAASAFGFNARPAMFPDAADPTHIATVELQSAPRAESPLFAAIPRRHTNRGAYETGRMLPASVFSSLEALGADLSRISVRWFASAQEKAMLGGHIVEAAQAIVADREQSRDSGAWFRTSWDEIQQKRDGLTIDAQALPAWLRVAAKVGPAVGAERADRVWLESTRDVHVGTAAAFGLLLARDANDNSQRVDGGRLWQRMHLWATTEGLAMHPLNQLPERADRERSQRTANRFGVVLEQVAGNPAWQALMPFRFGYPTVTALASPRRTVGEVVFT
jgi:hypothetical protein